MKVSKNFEKLITDEFEFAVERMSLSKDAREVLYFFSAIPGVLHRVFNIEFDSDLVFIHNILRSTQEAFSERLKAIKAGDATFILDEGQMERLIDLSKELLVRMKQNEEIDSTLKKFTLLLYSTTGNGYYLMQKGMLKI
jgi:hypothetical protein